MKCALQWQKFKLYNVKWRLTKSHAIICFLIKIGSASTTVIFHIKHVFQVVSKMWLQSWRFRYLPQRNEGTVVWHFLKSQWTCFGFPVFYRLEVSREINNSIKRSISYRFQSRNWNEFTYCLASPVRNIIH